MPQLTPKPIVLMAPTASGKTELALTLARQTGGQIISADSRQVYKHLLVGTAKPAGHWEDELYKVDGVVYHLVDFLEVTEHFNAGAFSVKARQITQQEKGPFIFAGGTGMYLQSYFSGMDALPSGTPQTRQYLTELAERKGKEGLHRELTQADPESAAQIPPGNIQRVMRALEIFLLTGKKASELRTGKFNATLPVEQATFVYLLWDKDLLAKRIAERTEKMIEGMAAETEALLKQGVSEDAAALKSLGYRQIIRYLKGELTRTEALEQIIILTRQYAKRQRTWFNRYKEAFVISLNTPEDFQPEALCGQILSWNK